MDRSTGRHDSGDAERGGWRTDKRRRKIVGSSILMATVAIVGCSPTVRVEAPSEPIEINLNVRITQEVRIQIDRELEEVFSENDDIF